MLKRTGFKNKQRKPLKRSAMKRVSKTSKKVTKKKVVTTTILKKKLWTECKRIIRQRHGNTCYTCGAFGLEGSNWQTGHFISSSICSVDMRYSLDNLRPQCMQCNIHRSGNWVAFEAHLMIDFGQDYPTQLKQRNEQTKNLQYDKIWYQNKLDDYKLL